jgi:hypothetical protein
MARLPVQLLAAETALPLNRSEVNDLRINTLSNPGVQDRAESSRLIEYS